MTLPAAKTISPSPLFVLPSRRDEAWRYSDIASLRAAQDLPAVTRPSLGRTLEDGARIEARLEAGDGAAHAHEDVRLQPGGRATLVHRLEGAGWLNAVIDIALPAAQLTHIIIQERAPDAVATARLKLHLDAEADYRLFVFQAGAQFGRIEVDAVLAGRQARMEMAAVQLATARQTLETVTRLRHAAPETISRQSVRNVLAGHAVGNYLGAVRVDKAAQKTDAGQSARTLLLARTATANTKPELEIYADDVKCAHGATVGALDERALFYLTARGIAPEQARALLTEAFIADLLAAIEDEQAREAIAAAARRWLEEALA
ncbi:MAG: SufD family Fe-S cluster assembly protein [Pseudomonadota bacterium]